MKETIRKLIEYFCLIKKYRKAYKNYYFNYRPVIYNALKCKNINRIKPVQKHEWKIWYNCCYFSGTAVIDTKEKPVFIKVMDKRLNDCYYNEQLINKYIDEVSLYLSERKPKLYYSIDMDGIYIMVYDFIKMMPVSRSIELDKEVKKVVSEYSRIGIIHTDFGISNFGKFNNMYQFFDYGTSLFYGSDHIRLRNSKGYNHIDHITETAKKLIQDADFYYDDLIHYGLDGIERESCNFIVSKDKTCFVKLGEKIYRYRLEKMAEGSAVYLLCKEENTES